jgi:hypothetical protein
MSYIPNSEYLMLYHMKIIIMKIFQSNLSYKKDQNLPLFCFHKKRRIIHGKHFMHGVVKVDSMVTLAAFLKKCTAGALAVFSYPSPEDRSTRVVSDDVQWDGLERQ